MLTTEFDRCNFITLSVHIVCNTLAVTQNRLMASVTLSILWPRYSPGSKVSRLYDKPVLTAEYTSDAIPYVD